jgi:2,4-dienoyl-CoA reductase-like NADH-dependent reductase (Old Yellow Enzyme family)
VEKPLSLLFDPAKIKNMALRNRFVRSATYDGLADKGGHVSKKQIELFKEVAEGGVGLVITGIFYVHPSGQVSPFQNSITGDEFIPGLKSLTNSVHDCGAKIAVQLFHGGREAKFVKTRNKLPMSPSFIEKDPHYKGRYQALTQDEIWEVIHSFGDGAKRAKQAGFDAVQVHGAHGYLLSQFLSPHTNRRQDKWGGDLENRLRFHMEIYNDIREKVGEDYPVLIKIGVQDGFSGGLDFTEGKQAAVKLAEIGYDALEISQGLRGYKYEGTEFKTGINKIEKEAYFRKWCCEIKSQVNVPVIMVGGLRTLSLMKKIVEKKEADFVSLCRPLIREPNLINKWKKNGQKKSKCISCNQCIEKLYIGEPLHCVQLMRE